MKFDAVEQAKNYLLERTGAAPNVAVIMGAGIAPVDEILRDTVRLHYVTIPHFPVPKVPGHRGQVAFGKAGNLNVIVFEGRVHLYEGSTIHEVTLCTRVLARMGAKTLILTNAAGAINPAFQRGQLMFLSDHINLLGVNPLTGPNEERWGPRFLDQTQVYDPELRQKLQEAARSCDMECVEGVYAAMPGPTYETPAEIRFLRAIGADAVGMSTVPEAIVARHMGLKVAGVSMLANLAAGLSGKPIHHDEVLESVAAMNADLGMLLLRFFERFAS